MPPRVGYDACERACLYVCVRACLFVRVPAYVLRVFVHVCVRAAILRTAVCCSVLLCCAFVLLLVIFAS